ncbi:MAG: glycosyltransferase family 4 protein, partial [Lachnospiraceae bacterium]|nr:glycosyltransferase family 4 protein [Lachnospiraceae bacterium]
MNIALFTDSYLPTKSGVVTVVEQIYQNLKTLGHHVVIVTVANPLADTKNESDDILRVPSTKIGLG